MPDVKPVNCKYIRAISAVMIAVLFIWYIAFFIEAPAVPTYDYELTFSPLFMGVFATLVFKMAIVTYTRLKLAANKVFSSKLPKILSTKLYLEMIVLIVGLQFRMMFSYMTFVGIVGKPFTNMDAYAVMLFFYDVIGMSAPLTVVFFSTSMVQLCFKKQAFTEEMLEPEDATEITNKQEYAIRTSLLLLNESFLGQSKTSDMKQHLSKENPELEHSTSEF